MRSVASQSTGLSSGSASIATPIATTWTAQAFMRGVMTKVRREMSEARVRRRRVGEESVPVNRAWSAFGQLPCG